jgi:hypothetical protein
MQCGLLTLPRTETNAGTEAAPVEEKLRQRLGCASCPGANGQLSQRRWSVVAFLPPGSLSRAFPTLADKPPIGLILGALVPPLISYFAVEHHMGFAGERSEPVRLGPPCM